MFQQTNKNTDSKKSKQIINSSNHINLYKSYDITRSQEQNWFSTKINDIQNTLKDDHYNIQNFSSNFFHLYNSSNELYLNNLNEKSDNN